MANKNDVAGGHVDMPAALVWPVALGSAVSLVFLLRFPVITVTHLDAFAYIEGALSLARGTGYADTAGDALNHWPPGYSLLLSCFQDPLIAARWINAVSLGAAVAALFRLSQTGGWSTAAASGLVLALGFGFLSSIAASAMPEIMTYAIFLSACSFLLATDLKVRSAGLAALGALPALKLVAVVFLPSALLLLIWQDGIGAVRRRLPEIAAGGVAWASTLLLLAWFNHATTGAAMPSHDQNNLSSFLTELQRFPTEFFRAFLANWYGSIRPPMHFAAFSVVLGAAIVAFASLRPSDQGRNFLSLGLLVLGLSWGLELVRTFYASPRLMGYGMLLIILGLAPAAASYWRWLSYAALTLAAALANSYLVAQFGSSDPAYRAMSMAVVPQLLDGVPVYTNSNGILDIHTGRRTIGVQQWPSPKAPSCLLHVMLPNMDAVGTSIWKIEAPPPQWHIVADLPTARVYCSQGHE